MCDVQKEKGPSCANSLGQAIRPVEGGDLPSIVTKPAVDGKCACCRRSVGAGELPFVEYPFIANRKAWARLCPACIEATTVDCGKCLGVGILKVKCCVGVPNHRKECGCDEDGYDHNECAPCCGTGRLIDAGAFAQQSLLASEDEAVALIAAEDYQPVGGTQCA